MGANYQTRPAAARDFDFAWAAYEPAVKTVIGAHRPWESDQERQRFRSIWSPEETVIIQVGGEDVGWVSVQASGQTMTITNLALLDAKQRQGVGTEVFNDLVSEARTKGQSLEFSILKGSGFVETVKRAGSVSIGEDQVSTRMQLR